MPATRLKLTERDRVGDTHSEELNGERWHAKMLRPKPYNQIQTHIYSVLSANTQMNDTTKKKKRRDGINSRCKRVINLDDQLWDQKQFLWVAVIGCTKEPNKQNKHEII